ncbi:hypothetical protein FGB62_25g613 [Gracilaria domingensis]|nr:hypothetical protein FGB62_25g613 [Gracilaria domingensis]
MVIRRPVSLEMHATIVDIPDGADVFESLNDAADKAGYVPTIVLSGIGLLSRAVLYVPNDEAIPEAMDIEKTLGVKLDLDGTKYPELHDLPRIRVDKARELGIEVPEETEDLRSKPHWFSKQSFDKPLSLLYARGGRTYNRLRYRYHMILSGSEERTFGRANSFVGEMLPGCVAKNPLQFVIGVSANMFKTNVQAWTINIESGYDVIERMTTFLNARQNLGDCFIVSGHGRISEAVLANIGEAEEEEHYSLRDEGKPYHIEDISGIVNCAIGTSRIHATIILNCEEPPCEAVGGRLIKAISSSDKPIEIVLGEITDEKDMIHSD